MAAVYKRDLETLYEELSGYPQNAEDLLRQNPNAERNDGDPEPMTRRIFTLNAENLYKRIHDLINEMSNTKEGWAAYIHSRSGAELSKANEDYSNFTLGPDGQKKHFTSYIREAKAAMRNISEAIMQQDVRENGGDRENPENPQEQENPEIQDNPENREDVERIRPVIQTVDLTQAPPVGLQVPDYTQPPPRVQAAAQEQQNFVQQTDSTLLLPRMKPPVFSGKSEQWLAFWEIFEASVHNKGISNVEKMSYLITLLEGEAKRAVSGYQICNANYLVVVELLKNRFGNKEAIAESLQAELIALPKAAENTHSLRNFSEAVERICRQMKAMSLSDDHPVIATAIKTKLPYNIIMKLIEKERASGIKWTATQIRQGLQEIIAVREEVQRNINEKNHTHTPNLQDRKNERNTRFGDQKNSYNSNRESTRAFPLTMNENSKGNQKSRCYFCGKGMHWSDQCRTISSPEERKKILAEQRRCFVCFKTGHSSKNCTGKGCWNCKQRHNTAICDKKAAQKAQKLYTKQGQKHKTEKTVANAASEEVPETAVTAVTQTTQPKEVLLMTKEACVSSPNHPNTKTQALIFFDNGSQINFITNEKAKELKLKKIGENDLEVYGFNQKPTRMNSAVYKIRIHLEDGKEQEVMLNGTQKITTGLKTTSVTNETKREWIQKLANLKSSTKEPDILIGMSDFWEFVDRVEQISLPQSGAKIHMIHTKIGPLICGQTQAKLMRNSINSSVIVCPISVKDEEVRQFWNLESIGVYDNPEDKDNSKAMELFQKSIRMVNGRYTVKWPWKDEVPNLPTNYQMSFCRLKSTLSKFREKPQILNEYNKIIQEQIRNGILEPAVINEGGLEHYLPHQPVIRMDKNTTKLRIVYDASAHPRDWASLNDCLYKGPTLLPDLAGFLMRFRTKKIVLLADIEKAFLQIALEEEDKKVTKFLWVKDTQKPLTNDNIVAYQSTRVVFGIISSPFILAATILHHLRKYNSELAKEIEKNIYVDNIMMSAETAEEAIIKYSKSKELFEDAKMNLREYVSNSKEVNEHIVEKDRLDKTNAKVLGIPWNVGEDKLIVKFMPKQIFEQKRPTKRSVLQDLAGTFDPLGLVTPATLPAKLFFQKLWNMSDKSWDRGLNEKEADEWTKIAKNLAGKSVERRRITPITEESQLHVFVDASQNAYAAAIYIRSPNCANIIYSKNRLKPGGGMTIPRMELMGILIGVRMLQFVEEQLHQKFSQKVLWCDSQCALRWIQSTEDKTKFVKNRLKEIRKHTECSFRYVPTEDNPADLSTRGCTPEELSVNEQWWHGPHWLSQNEENWPQILEVKPPEEPEITVTETLSCALNSEEPIMKAERFSSWTRMQRAMAYALRYLARRATTTGFLQNFRNEGPLTAEEIKSAKLILLKNHQKSSEITQEKFKNWKLYEENGLLKIQSRLANSELSDEAKNPIFLYPKARITELIIMKCHAEVHHAGVEATVTRFLREYWTLHARQEVRSALRTCAVCKIIRGKPFALPRMPPLPRERTEKSSPFSAIGIDYIGPTLTKEGEKTKKAWILLITCLATRAVYLDVVTEMGTEAFLNAFRRFVARRGKPEMILSDNATQFKAAEICLKKTWQELKGTEFSDYYANQEIRWKFINEFSPWQGSVYERLVALVKDAFKKVLGRKVLRIDDLQTFTAEVEASLNQRPITYVSTDADTWNPLRPIDFLAPFKTITLEGPNPEEGEDWLPKRLTRDKVLEVWRNTTDRLGKFWDRWKNEYLVLLRDKLHAEHKGTRWQHYREPKLNEIVLVEEDYLPRNMWKLGKIVELKDSSGAVRAAKVLMPNKNVLTRPINRLYTLEIEGKDEKSTKETKNPEEEKRKTYNLRDRNRIKKTAFYTIISLVMCLAVAQAAPTAMKCNDCQMKCSNRGVKLILPKYIDKAEICCEEQDCHPYQGKEEITVTLSDSALINEYTCEAKLWQKTEVKEKLRIKCAAKNECDLINCYVCSKRLQNPECRPNVTTIIYGVGITVAFCVLYSLMKIVWELISNMFYCLRFVAFCVLYSLMKIVWELISKMFYCLRFACCLCQVMYTLCNRKKQKSHTANKEEKQGLLGTSEEEKGSSCVEKGPKPQKSYFGFRFIRASRNSLSGGKMAVAILAILYLMAGYTEGCAEIISLKAREEKCVKNQNGTICSLNEVTELTLLPTGQEACLLISDVKGEPMGTLKLKLDGIRIKCMPSIQSITRSYVAKIYGNHRCPRMGSCMNDYCSTVELNTQVEELKDYENYPGNNFCVDSCTTYDCETWCALPTPSCVFYRVYAMPLSDTIYEVFTCPDWVYEVKLDLKMEVNRTEETSEIIAAEGITTRWKEISVSPVAITRPPAPLFGQHFVSDGINAAMVTEFTTDLSCVNYTAANELKCSLNPKACQNCRDNSQKINCHCRDSNIEEIMENPSSRLPLEVGRYEMKNEGKEVFAESRHTPVQLVVKLEGLSLATLNHENTCKIKPLEITGCYRCDSGAKLTYECETDFGEALAIVRCAEASFTQTCDNSSKTYTASLHFNTAEVKTMCNVTCPKETTQFELEAVLQYVPKSVQMLSETQSKNNEEIGLFTCDICDIDLRHAMNFLFAWDRILIVVLVISVSSVILMLCLKYNPMIRIMRKGYRLLAIFAIMPLLGLQSMVLAHPVNGGNAIHQNDSLGTSIFPYNDVTQPKASFIPAVPDLLSTLQHIVMSKASKIRKLEAQLAALREEADSDSSDSSITSGNAPVDSRNFTVSDFVIDEAREDNGKREKKRAHELKCSRCANFGHTSRSKRCPLNSAEKNRAEKPTRPLPPGKRPPGFPNEEEEEEIAVAALIENEEIVKTPCYEEAAENIPVGESNPIEKTLPTEKIEEQAFCEKSEEKAEENEKKRSEDSGEEKGEKRSGEEIVNTQKIEKNSAACREKVEKIDCVKEKSTEERDEMTAVEKREEKKMSKAENNEKAEPGKTPTRSGNESYDSEQKKFGESRGLSKSGDKTEREKSHQKSPKETEKTKESEKKKAALEAYHIPKLTSSWKERIKRSVESLPRNELFPQRNIPEDEEIRSFIKEEIERAVSREIDTSLGILKMELKQEMRKSRNDLADVLEACASSLRKKRDSSPGVHVSGTGRKRSPKRSSRPEYR